jgi:hypothetical protein
MDAPRPIDVLGELCKSAVHIHSTLFTHLRPFAESVHTEAKLAGLSLYGCRIGELRGIYTAICHFNGWDPAVDANIDTGGQAERFVLNWWRINHAQHKPISIAEIDAMVDSLRQDVEGDVDRWTCRAEKHLNALKGEPFNARHVVLAVAATLTLSGVDATVAQWSEPTKAGLSLMSWPSITYMASNAGWSLSHLTSLTRELGHKADVPITTLRHGTDPRAVAMAITRHAEAIAAGVAAHNIAQPG